VPFVKWVGGKRSLVAEITSLMAPINLNNITYHEPFIGGGALFLNLQPPRAVINDLNPDLIIAYRMIKERPKALYDSLKVKPNSKDKFLTERSLDRNPNFKDLPELDRASRFIYLNKTCYNGMWRENSKGQFNVPFSNNNMNPEAYLNLENALGISDYLNRNDIIIKHGTYVNALKNVSKGDFVYLDPPYYPLNATSSFTSYTKSSFGVQEQIDLKKACDEIASKGAFFVASNSSHSFIRGLYQDYRIEEVRMRRSINSKGHLRGEVKELLITNIDL